MANRIAKFASAIFASLLAGAPITIITSSFTHAASDCQGERAEQATSSALGLRGHPAVSSC
jgi:hypothetical protein